MFLPTASQVAYMAKFDAAQKCPISIYQMLADSITINVSASVFVVPSGLSLVVGDSIYLESSGVRHIITDITAGFATAPTLITNGNLVSCIIRKIAYANGATPYIYELMPKELGVLSNMADRTITRAWAARIAKTPELLPIISSNSRFVLDDEQELSSVALLDNIVSGTANPNLAWSLYLVP